MGLFDFITNPIGSIASSVIGGAASYFGTQSNNQAMQQMQQQQEAYNTQMSNTAYQRASADMKSAGLNPMMMFGSGSAASSPTAPGIQLQSPLQNAGSALKDVVSSAMQAKVQDATIDNLVQQNANLKTDQALHESDKQLRDRQVLTEMDRQSNIVANTQSTKADTAKSVASLPQVINASTTATNELSTPGRKLLDQSGYAGKKVSDIVDPIATGISSASGVKRLVKGIRSTSQTSKDPYSGDTFQDRWSSH
jgi:hypothetical protein